MELEVYILIPIILALVMMCLLSVFRCRRRKRSVVQMSTTTIYTVPTNYNSVTPNVAPTPAHVLRPQPSVTNFGHNRISSQGDRFAVPIDLLPPNFDYTAPGVECKENYVLVKDLSVIHVPTNDVHPKDEYQKQLPYNPNFQ